MYDIAIVDDDQGFARSLKGFIELFGSEAKTEFHTALFSSGFEFLSACKPLYDIVFLDIAMPGFNGMQTAQELRARDKDVTLIFITNMTSYAVRGYAVEAFDFVPKPVNYSAFKRTLERALSKREGEKTGNIVLRLRDNDGIARVNAKDISSVETDGHYLVYHTRENDYEARGRISDTEKKLSGFGFARSAKGDVINLRYVTELKDRTLVAAGRELPLEKSRRKAFIQALTAL
jgi:DNA-binding LytR/AlgR family response regulator